MEWSGNVNKSKLIRYKYKKEYIHYSSFRELKEYCTSKIVDQSPLKVRVSNPKYTLRYYVRLKCNTLNYINKFMINFNSLPIYKRILRPDNLNDIHNTYKIVKGENVRPIKIKNKTPR